MSYFFKTYHRLSDIGETTWQSLTTPHYPFLQYAFLEALESSECCKDTTGWQPFHQGLYRETAGEPVLIAVMPMYLKTHSYGEYVFDWAWADAYHRNGIDYYPKLLNAIPFSPCSGPRIASMENPETLIALYIPHLQQLCHKKGIQSWHSLFHSERESELHVNSGMLQRLGCQFHWYNKDYTCFDHYLQSFNSRKRKSIKRERRQVAEQNIEIITLEGAHIQSEQLQAFYHCYHSTYLKRGRQGYLNYDFFERLLAHMPQHLVMFCALDHGQIVACALCFKNTDPQASVLFGRYWGCLDEYHSLHFETCYYHGLEYCITHHISSFDPGAQGEHKIQRGFEPTLTYSSHYIVHPQFSEAIADFLAREAPAIKAYRTEAEALLPFKQAHL